MLASARSHGRRRARQPGGRRSATAARHLRHLRRRRGVGRGEHGLRREAPRLARRRAVGARGEHRDAALPAAPARTARHRNRFHRGRARARAGLQGPILDAAYEEAGIGPEDVSLAEVYDLSTALELDWYEHLGLCAKGEAEALLRSGATTIGGRVPVNPSGGLACFGEAIPAQAIAQVCELTWQLRGQATGRQVEGATVGITANQGLFGHGSSVIVAR